MAFDFLVLDATDTNRDNHNVISSTYGKAGAGILYQCFDAWDCYAGVSGSGEGRVFSIDLFRKSLSLFEGFLSVWGGAERGIVHLTQHYKFIDEVKLATEVNIFSNKVYDVIISSINWEK